MAAIAKTSMGYLTTDSDAQLIVSTNTILAAMAANVGTFATPNPSLTVVQTALDAFMSAINDAQVGGPEQTTIKIARRAELVALLRLLAYYVTVTSNGNMAQLQSSGFAVQQTPGSPIGPLPTPNTPAVAQGQVTGSVTAKTAPVRGASIYNWRIALASAPAVYVQTAQTPGSRVTFNGLTPGQIYNVQLNAVGAAGTSNWSDDGSMMII